MKIFNSDDFFSAYSLSYSLLHATILTYSTPAVKKKKKNYLKNQFIALKMRAFDCVIKNGIKNIENEEKK